MDPLHSAHAGTSSWEYFKSVPFARVIVSSAMSQRACSQRGTTCSCVWGFVGELQAAETGKRWERPRPSCNAQRSAQGAALLNESRMIARVLELNRTGRWAPLLPLICS